MQAEATIYFVIWWVLFEYSSFDYFPYWQETGATRYGGDEREGGEPAVF